jgi:predicted flap endonuclease-1-like 5' DNA nuclease
MLRRLSRLLIIALLLALVAFAVSRLMGGDDDDFDDFDDLDSGFEFQETPVEIDVPTTDATTSQDNSPTPSSQAASSASATTTVRQDEASNEAANSNGHEEGRLIDINGIGPAYEARLQAIGINSIHDLAHADADSIASQMDVIGGTATIEEWITQARSQHSHGQ